MIIKSSYTLDDLVLLVHQRVAQALLVGQQCVELRVVGHFQRPAPALRHLLICPPQ